MFGKYFAQTFTGSMAGAGVIKHAVWGYCIANARADGTIEINPVNLSAALGECTAAQIEDALAFLCSPDPKSRTKTLEGRKLQQIADYEYRITNHAQFRAIKSEDDRREYNRIKKQEERERNKAKLADEQAIRLNPEMKQEIDGRIAGMWAEERERVSGGKF